MIIFWIWKYKVYKELKNGCFSLKRTNKPFSRLPIDLTLEQTINADAASQRHGITALTNSISARHRWAQSHYLRTTVISTVHEDLGMMSKEDITQDLKNCQIKERILSILLDWSKILRRQWIHLLNPLRRNFCSTSAQAQAQAHARNVLETQICLGWRQLCLGFAWGRAFFARGGV